MVYAFLNKRGVIALTTGLLAADFGVAHASEYGTEVVNIASVSYVIGDVVITHDTNPAVFVIEPPKDIPPTIEFFRYSPNAPQSVVIDVQVNGSDYSPSGNITGPFVETGPASTVGRNIDLSSPISLIPATTYIGGELVFVQVTDVYANTDPNAVDTVVIEVSANSVGIDGVSSGDTITLRLYETGPNTGEFWAYVPIQETASTVNDNELTARANSALTATYTDAVGEIDVVVDTATVDPTNLVFNSMTGEPINGAQITVMDMSSHEQAIVYGVDTFSMFPSHVVSGETTEDASGLPYINGAGAFTFPHLEEGEYIVEVIPPEGYTFASALSPTLINEITGAGYFVIDASYGRPINLEIAGPLRFDIPLDPETELRVTKQADRADADIGDFVNYSINIENNGDELSRVNLVDILPYGFRYVPGTARVDGLEVTDPAVKNTGTELAFDMGMITPGQVIKLDYALEIGPGAQLGEAVNRAVIQGLGGNALSNVGRASVTIREDLLRSKSTVIGRISEKSCNGDEDWARKVERGIGVAGVRVYMETGAYAVSDQDGLFHFEGIAEGTHVVQIDKETLPKGFAPMVCEENSRYANNNTSKFVDIKGGGIWRANFYLEQVGATEEEVTLEVFEDKTEYKEFDAAWLETQSDEAEWVYPLATRTPSQPSVNIGIKHPAGAKVQLRLNGHAVSGLNYTGRDSNAAQSVHLSRWKGVDVLKGENLFEATILDSQGNVLKTITQNIWYVDNIARASGVSDRSVLVADGRTVPTIAIRLEDESGRPVHAGRVATIDVESPYRVYDEHRTDDLYEGQSDLLAPLSARQDITVGPDGIAEIKLEPTLKTGKVTVNVKLDTGRIVPIYMYLKPEERDWIIVGLAEGSVGYETVKDKSIALDASNSDVINDGRVAFFAKGMIKGNWLMTLALDTDKRRGGRDGDFENEIDPNAYYTLYGDRSYQDFEGVSRYPVYLKLEKNSAYALFGDYDTNVQEGRLTAYNRRMTGLKAEYVGDKFQVMGFAAETDQGFAKDELAADGTSGIYHLSHNRILAQSETVVIETRDRNRPDVILDRKELVRYLDYTLDYLTGELIFRMPVDVSDESFNPNVIVVDYETSENAERNVTFGGRVQADLMNGRVRVGSTGVQENGAADVSGAKSSMIGVDMVADVTDNTELRLEYAITDNSSDEDDSHTASAILAEVIHTSEKFNGEAYYREEEEGYGLGQRNSNTNAFRRYGVEGSYKLSEFEGEETGRRGMMTVEAGAYHEDNLSTGDARDTGEVLVSRRGERLTVSGGLRASRDELVNSDDRESLLAIAKASYDLPEHGATFSISQEQPLGGKDEVSNYPQRTTLGVDKTVGANSSVSIRHEILDGANASGQNTTVGVKTAPWTGGQITASSDLLTSDSSRRLGATVGLDQQVQINDKWSASGGLRNRRVFDEQGTYIDVSGDAAISPLELNEDFTSAYVGLGYRAEKTSVSGRVEARDSSAGETWIGSAAAAREMTETLSFAGAGRIVRNNPKEDDLITTQQSDLRIGAAWRPRDEGTVVYDRLDLSQEKTMLGQNRSKIVNNVAINTMVSDRWQLTGHYGAKYVREDIAGKKEKSFTNLVGGEMRFDVTERIDLGLSGSAIVMSGSDQVAYSVGPSIGFAPVDDVWISAGYNLEGYQDDDFEAAEFSREGFYLKLRIKFDQDSARGLLRRISPAADTVGTSGASPARLSR